MAAFRVSLAKGSQGEILAHGELRDTALSDTLTL
jgi:hypothetical protein